jgi:hypothetical protein
MEKTEPINPSRKVNLFVKILLYPQVTSFKIVKALPTLSDYRNNYNSRGLSFCMVVFTESVIFYFLFPHIELVYFKRFFLVICLYHGVFELIFNKKIYEMAFDYYAYYNKASLYAFFFFLAIDIAEFCIIMYNSIGHVT